MFTFFHGCGIPPVTLTCPQGGGAQAQTILGPTAYPTCTVIGPTAWQGCGVTGSFATVCPPTHVPGCNQGGGAQAQTIGVTGWQGCHVTTPPACLGPTAYPGCTFVGPTGTQGCTQGGGAQAQTLITVTTTVIPTAIQCITKVGGAHAQTVGPTGSVATVCPPTHVPGCQSPTGSFATICPPTRVPGCNVGPKTWFQGCGIPPVTLTCPQGGAQAQTQHLTGNNGCTMICNNTANCPDQAQPDAQKTIGVTGWQGCQPTVPPACYGPTGTEGCTVPPNCLGPTGTQGCGDTLPTVCTQIGCGPTHLIGCTGYQGCDQNAGGGAEAQVPTIPVADCIPTRHCTGAWPVC